MGQKVSKSQLWLQTGAGDSLQRLSSCRSGPRCRSSAVGSLPGTMAEKPAHGAGRREEVTAVYCHRWSRVSLRLEAQREEPPELRMKCCLGRSGPASAVRSSCAAESNRACGQTSRQGRLQIPFTITSLLKTFLRKV